jgi:hypothetical protein
MSQIVTPANIVSDSIEGFSLIKRVNSLSPYEVIYDAIQLNFFPLSTTYPCRDQPANRCGVWYSHVSVGEQPAEYFKPPAGVTVAARADVQGIVRRP